MHDDLRVLLSTLSPTAHEHLRDVFIRDRPTADAIASQLLRYRDGHGDDWADIIDMLTMHPEERRKVARMLGEIEAHRTLIPTELAPPPLYPRRRKALVSARRGP
ncbi:MAG TPA: hypothetical protein VNG34_00550 [Actinomycetota bacterium]|nr:hypothetical protein [Actinomycetota bacterium]